MLSFSEMLKGKQHKLDKNKNGKLDKHDFKLLRKEDLGMKEDVKEAEELDERNQENATKRKMMDASRGSRYKLNNPVPDASPEHKTAQAHNKAIGRALRKEESEEIAEEQIDELSHGTLRSYVDKAKAENLPGKGGNRGVALLTPGTRDKGVHKAVDKMKKMKANEEVEEIDEKINVATTKMGDVIKDFQKSDAPQFAGKSAEKRRQMAIAAKLQADRIKKEGVEMKSYKQFMEELIDKLPGLEEAEQIDEVGNTSAGQETLKSYAGKVIDNTRTMPQGAKKQKHLTGLTRAMDRIKKEEVEQIDELDINLLKSMQKHAKANPRPKSSSDDAIDPKTGRLKPYGYRGKSEYEKSETGDDDEPKKVGRKTGVSVGSYKRRQPK